MGASPSEFTPAQKAVLEQISFTTPTIVSLARRPERGVSFFPNCGPLF